MGSFFFRIAALFIELERGRGQRTEKGRRRRERFLKKFYKEASL